MSMSYSKILIWAISLSLIAFQDTNAKIDFGGANVQDKIQGSVNAIIDPAIEYNKVISPELKSKLIKLLRPMSPDERNVFIKNISTKIDILLKNSKLSQKNQTLLRAIEYVLVTEGLKLQIGSFATNITNIYTVQIQKARDTTRLSDLSSLQAGVEQYYQDKMEYPLTIAPTNIGIYVPKIPKDPKDWETINGCKFWYTYKVGPDVNWIKNNAYILSTCFENTDNIEKRAKSDGGSDPLRYEMGSPSLDKNPLVKSNSIENISGTRVNTNTWTLVNIGKPVPMKSNSNSDNYYRDDKFVYYGGREIPFADINTFRVLSYLFAKDKNRVYIRDSVFDVWLKYLMNENPENVDVTTFNVIDWVNHSDYAYDRNYIYHYKAIIGGVDIGTFKILGYTYCKDKNHVYSTAYSPTIIEWADLNTFEEIASLKWYGKDKNFVYQYWELIEWADPSSFKVLSDWYAKDKNYYYKDGKITTGP